MVSIRKRRHLGIQEKYKILNQLNRQNLAAEHKPISLENSFPKVNTHPVQVNIEKKEQPEVKPETSVAVIGSLAKASNNNPPVLPASVPKVRKTSRRKQTDNQDSCMLRGVYFKNMKWQAAIKVEKKQIHLGTVASMEEAAHLYDRAAYLCGRVPNFMLSEEEKQELQGLHWDEFLQMTKEAIANKKKQKRVDTCMKRRRVTEGDQMNVAAPFNHHLTTCVGGIPNTETYEPQHIASFNNTHQQQQKISLPPMYQEQASDTSFF